MGDKLWLYQLKTNKVLLFVKRFNSIGTRKGKYLVLRTNMKPQRFIKHSKISYSIVILIYHKCSCVTHGNYLNRSVSKRRHSKYLRKYETCQFDTFCRESAFYSCTDCGTSKKELFVSRRYQLIIFSDNFKILD